MSAIVGYVDIIKALGICDSTGHVQSCGYESAGDCSCASLAPRLRDLLAAHDAEVRADEQLRMKVWLDARAEDLVREAIERIASEPSQ